jgi:arylsulfatase A-like enzyme
MRVLSVLAVLVLTVPAFAKPNVLIVITDDQGYGDLSCHGNDQLKTPHLDQLASESVRFDRFFVSPLCAPTRASLLTGRYSLRTGVKGVSAGAETMRAGEVTIAELLRDAGYRTGLFGKWHNGEHFPHTPTGQGFQTSFGYNLGHWNNYFDTTLKRSGKWEKTKGFLADVITDEAIGFLKAKDDRPFFCYLSLPTPHSPFQVPDAYFDRHKKLGKDDRAACVYGMCENLDDNIGRVLKALDDLKRRDDTVVIFLTDNGPNGARYNGGMKGVKGTLHEGGSRVPLFVRYPARFKPQLVKPIAAHIDLLPTLADLCGVPLPKGVALDGVSLLPLLDGKADVWKDRTLFTQHQLLPAGVPKSGAVRTQTHRLVGTNGKWELFDMTADPGQTKDISTTQPDLTNKLRTEFEAWYADVRKGAEGDRLPIPVGHPEEETVELPAAQSAFGGGVKFNGKHANNAWLVGWDSTAANAEWQLDVVRGAKYDVRLQYLCPEKQAGSTVRVTLGDHSHETVVTGTPVKQVPSPDRVPREEVYEMEWHTLPAGTVELKPGRTALRVQPTKVMSGSAMELKAVVLTRQAEGK